MPLPLLKAGSGECVGGRKANKSNKLSIKSTPKINLMEQRREEKKSRGKIVMELSKHDFYKRVIKPRKI